jgi:hypothetical protein
MKLTKEQQQVATAFLREARRQGASYKQTKALIEAGLVESNLRNLNYGDRDSIGSLQERSHYGSAQRRRNPTLAARRFLNESKSAKGATSGQLAQNVQRSAFPDRYDQRGGDAAALIRQLGGGVGGAVTKTSAGGTSSGLDPMALYAYLQNRHDPSALSALAAATQNVASKGTQTPSKGKSVGKAISGTYGVKEAYFGSGGIENGKRVPGISGHGGHVHAAGMTRAETLRMAKLAKKLGLSIRELAEYDKVDPVHTKNSHHYSKSGALDASGDKRAMAEFFRLIGGR